MTDETKTQVLTAEYTSVWDDCFEITTECKFDPEFQVCFDITDSEQAPTGTLTDEYVTLPDGRELRDQDGVSFEY